MKVATLCYLKKDHQTLMLHRIKKENDMHKGKWVGVGGKFERGEDADQCAIREIKEETGLDAKNPELKGILTFPDFDGQDDWLVFLYKVSEFSGKLIQPREGILEWIDDDELYRLPMWDGDESFMRLLDRPGVFSAKYCYKEGRCISHEIKYITSG